jgi:twitching motility protein PilJ
MDQPSDMSSLSQSPRRKAEQGAGNRQNQAALGSNLQAGNVLEGALATSARGTSAPRRASNEGGAGFKDVPVGQKLALIALSLLLPIGLLLYFATSRVQQDVAFSAKERVGVEYLKPIKDLQNLFQDYRLYLTNLSQGDTKAAQQLSDTIPLIDAAIADLTAVDKRNNSVLEVTPDITTLQGKWNTLQAQVDILNLNMLEITPAIQEVLEGSLAPLFIKVADNSNLTLDPDVDTYYLQNMLVNEMPAGISRLGAFRTVSRTAVGDDIIDAKERTSLASNFARAEDAVNGIFASLDRAKAASPFVAQQIADAEKTARDAAFGLVNTLGEKIVNVEQPTLTFEEASALTNPRAPLYALYDVALVTLDNLLEKRIQGLQRVNIFTLAGVAASLLLAFVIIYFITRQITRPLRELSNVSDNLARGDLSQVANIESRDEIGSLAKSFNNAILQLRDANARQETEIARGQKLQNNIGEFLNVAMDIAQGDFTKRGQVSEDALGNVVDAINFMTEELGYVLKDVQHATDSVNQGATDMFGTADTIARSAEMQAVEAQKARIDVQDIRSTMRQVSEEMTLSAESANKALTASREGQQAVVKTLEGMQDIRREVQAVSKRVKTLGDRSLEISEIVETISRISEQTNLLAVNAAIESSGAGEAGLRFSVVADQVRKLAEESAYAAERVSILIKTVQDEVQEVITGVEAGTREVEEGYRVASQAGQRLEDISAIVERSASLAQRISQATQDQVARVEQVGQVVEQMAEISVQSQDTVTKGREAAEKLQLLAAQLSDNLSRFRLA